MDKTEKLALISELISLIMIRRKAVYAVRFNVADNIAKDGHKFAAQTYSEFKDILGDMNNIFVADAEKVITDDNRVQIYMALEALSAARDFIALERMFDKKADGKYLDEDKNYLSENVKLGYTSNGFVGFLERNFKQDAAELLKYTNGLYDEVIANKDNSSIFGIIAPVFRQEYDMRAIMIDFLSAKKDKNFFLDAMKLNDTEITDNLLLFYQYADGTMDLTADEVNGIVDTIAYNKKLRDVSLLFTVAPDLAAALFTDEIKEMQALKMVLSKDFMPYSYGVDMPYGELIAQNSASAFNVARYVHFKHRLPTVTGQMAAKATASAQAKAKIKADKQRD